MTDSEPWSICFEVKALQNYRFEVRNGDTDPKCENAVLASLFSARAQAVRLLVKSLKDADRFCRDDWTVTVVDDTGEMAFHVGTFKPDPVLQ